MASRSAIVSAYPRDRNLLTGYRNKLINGNFDVWQRGTGSVGTGAQFIADRFYCFVSGSTLIAARAEHNTAQVAVPGNPTYYLAYSITTGNTAGSLSLLRQNVEDVRTLAGKKVTFTFYAWAATTTPKKAWVEFAQAFGVGGSSTVTSIGVTEITLTETVTRYDIVVDIPSIAGKTIGVSSHLQVNIWLDGGANNASRIPGIQLQSGDFRFARMSLVEGDARSEADPYEPRHIHQEISLCERYAKRIVVRTLTSAQFVGWWVQGATGYGTMRVSPTKTITIQYSALVGLPLSVDYEANGYLSLRSQATAAGAAEFLANVLLEAEF